MLVSGTKLRRQGLGRKKLLVLLQKQRPFTPLSPWVALCTCSGVAHAVCDPAWRLCFKCSLLLAAASRQTAGQLGLTA